MCCDKQYLKVRTYYKEGRNITALGVRNHLVLLVHFNPKLVQNRNAAIASFWNNKSLYATLHC